MMVPIDMTDQLTPTDDDRTRRLSFAPPRRANRVKSEIMAGGAVSEHGEDELANGWKGLLSMAAILALFVWLAFVNIWIFVFVVGVVISIFLHELGHYLTARWTGMKVTQFFLFFGPRLWSFRRGETEYGVRAIAARCVRAHRRHEPDGRGRTRRRGTQLPPGRAFPKRSARDLARARSCTS
jgi:hypothetical protein